MKGIIATALVATVAVIGIVAFLEARNGLNDYRAQQADAAIKHHIRQTELLRRVLDQSKILTARYPNCLLCDSEFQRAVGKVRCITPTCDGRDVWITCQRRIARQ